MLLKLVINHKCYLKSYATYNIVHWSEQTYMLFSIFTMGLFCAYGYFSFLEDKGKFKYYHTLQSVFHWLPAYFCSTRRPLVFLQLRRLV